MTRERRLEDDRLSEVAENQFEVVSVPRVEPFRRELLCEGSVHWLNLDRTAGP